MMILQIQDTLKKSCKWLNELPFPLTVWCLGTSLPEGWNMEGLELTEPLETEATSPAETTK